jgi:hypothetical protein
MSKGNGRKSGGGKGNGMDKLSGTCNGVSSDASVQSDQYSNQGKPNAIDSKAPNFKFNNVPANKSIKEFKNEIK